MAEVAATLGFSRTELAEMDLGELFRWWRQCWDLSDAVFQRLKRAMK